jgi:Ig-like domain from next to BRCA1 gene
VSLLARLTYSAAIASLLTITAFVPITPAQAAPAPGLCAMDTSRGAVPADFPLDACINSSEIVIRNTLPVPVNLSLTGSAGKPVRIPTDFGTAADLTRFAYSDPLLMLPGDIMRVPVTAGSASVSIAGTEAGGFYAIATALNDFLPGGAIKAVWDSATVMVTEMSDDFGQYESCISGKNWIGQLGCQALLIRNLAFAVARGVITGTAHAVLALLVNTVTFLKWVHAQPGAIANILGHSRTITASSASVPSAGSPSNGPTSGSTTPGSAGAGSADCEAFVADVTVPDGTVVNPGTTFEKTWRLRNCGRTNWSGLTAVRVAGNYGPSSFAVPIAAPGAVTDVTVPITAPTQPGLSRATYRLQAPDGHYADNSFWVDVEVVANSPNRQAIISYDQMRPGAPYHGYFATAWQPFTAASNTITWISATVGNPAAAAGGIVQGATLTIRICSDQNCSAIVAEAHPEIVNYGETGADIGDIAVTQGRTYYIVWYQPSSLNGSTWVTYWWGGGNTISTSDSMQAAVRGYDR